MATERLQKLLEMERQKPEDAFLKFAVAQEYIGLGDDEKALGYFEILLAQYPHYVPTYYHFGKLCERAGNVSRAVEIYKAGIIAATAAHDAKTLGELNEALMQFEDE